MSTYAEDNITITSQKSLNDKVENVNQYFWYEETGTHAGAHITEVPQDDFKTNPQGGNLLAKSNGLAVRDGTTELATFGADGATIGETSNTHLEMDFHSIQGIDKEGNTYFHLSDLRDANGDAEVIVTFTQRGSEVTFWFDLQAKDTNYTVVVSDGSGGSVTKNINYVRFASAPTRGATITVTYTTTSEYAKAYTLGFRLASADVGAMSVAEGFFTTASGMFSHTEGDNTVASGSASHAQGHYTTAHGGASHAEGDGTEAMAYCAHAQGYHTKALSGYQTVLGVFNIGDSTGKYAIILGNGTSDNARANVLTVDWQGNVDITGEYRVNGVAIPRSADYIIEQGTMNGWIYRKWNSGLAELWCTVTITAQTNTSDAGGYVSASPATPQAFPFTFASVPTVQVTCDSGGVTGSVTSSVRPSVTSAGSWKLYRNSSNTNTGNKDFNFYVIGTEEQQTGITNLIPLSEEVSSSAIFNNGLGYKNGYYISVGHESANANDCMTGCIPYVINGSQPTDVLYIKGYTGETNASHTRMCVRKADKSSVSEYNGFLNSNGVFDVELLAQNYYKLTPKANIHSSFADVGWLQFSFHQPDASGIIITKNQPIE